MKPPEDICVACENPASMCTCKPDEMAVVRRHLRPGVRLVDHGNRDRWLAARSDAIGASDAPALFGASPYASAFSLWAEKSGQATIERGDDEALAWGRLLEGPIAERYATAAGDRLVAHPGTYVTAENDTVPGLRATPDRWVLRAPARPGYGLLQIKNATGFLADDWRDGPPLAVQIQVQAEMLAAGARWAAVAVLLGGARLKTFDVDANDAFQAELVAQVAWFWRAVRDRRAPAIDAHEATAAALKRLHPLDDGSEIELDEAAAAASAEWEAAKAARKEAETRAEAAENTIRLAIGGATYGALPDGRRMSLKNQTRRAYTADVAEATFRVLRIEKGKGKRR